MNKKANPESNKIEVKEDRASKRLKLEHSFLASAKNYDKERNNVTRHIEE